MASSDMVVIGDNNYRNFINPTVDGELKACSSKGMWNRTLTPDPEGYAGTFEDLESVPMIPESEWGDRIRQMEKDKTRMPDFAKDMGLAIRNQRNSSYCWSFGTTRSAEYALLQTGINMHISAFSVGAPVKNFRNQGGWGDQALAYMAKNGFNTSDEWDDSKGSGSISRKYYTDENRALAKKRVVLEYYKLRTGRNGWAELVSCILAGKAVAVGYNFWSHLVCATWLEQNMDLGIDNSWGQGWSDGGRGLLTGGRKFPDGAVVINTVLAV